jgi:hypothetical protein
MFGNIKTFVFILKSCALTRHSPQKATGDFANNAQQADEMSVGVNSSSLFGFKLLILFQEMRSFLTRKSP